jgi:hypothetical protein
MRRYHPQANIFFNLRGYIEHFPKTLKGFAAAAAIPSVALLARRKPDQPSDSWCSRLMSPSSKTGCDIPEALRDTLGRHVIDSTTEEIWRRRGAAGAKSSAISWIVGDETSVGRPVGCKFRPRSPRNGSRSPDVQCLPFEFPDWFAACLRRIIFAEQHFGTGRRRSVRTLA